MLMSRAGFIRTSILAVLNTVVQPGSNYAFPFSFGRKTIMVKDLKLETFQPCVNNQFTIHRQDLPSVDVELTSAKECPSKNTLASGLPRFETFSLIFRGPKDLYIEQNTYEFEHKELGFFSLFITPVVGADQKGNYYQALFNRIVESDGE